MEVAVELDVRAAGERLLNTVVVPACNLSVVVTVRAAWGVTFKLLASTAAESTIVFEVAVVRLKGRLTLRHSVFTSTLTSTSSWSARHTDKTDDDQCHQHDAKPLHLDKIHDDQSL